MPILPEASCSVGTMEYEPAGLSAVAELLLVAVIASPFLSPETVPVKVGLGLPAERVTSSAMMSSGAGVTVKVPLLTTTE